MGKKKDGKKVKAAGKDELPEAAEVAGAVIQAARSLRTALGRGLAESGLYAGQDGVILALAEGDDGLTPGQLAARLGVKAPTMTRTIGRMEAQGFVERQPDAGDGRVVKVRLTPAGRESVAAIGCLVAACGTAALAGFSEKQARNLLKLLRAVDGNLRHGGGPARSTPVAEEEA